MPRLEPITAATFAVAAAYVPGIFSAAYMPRWWAAAVLIPALCQIDPSALPRWALWSMVSGMAWALASLLWTPIPSEGFGDILLMAVLCVALIAGASVRSFDQAMTGYSCGIAISAGFAVLQWRGIDLGIPRTGIAGLFMNSEIAAEAAAPVVAWAVFGKPPGGAWVRLFLLAAAMVAMTLAGARLAFLAAGAGVLIAVRCRSGIKVALFGVLGCGAMATLWVMGIDRASSGLTRVVLWLAGMMSIRPMGNGAGWWPVAFPGPFEEYAHSDVIQLMAELGLGAVPLLALPALALFLNRKRDEGDGAYAVLACLCFESAFSFAMHSPAPAVLGAVAAGHLLGRWHSLRDSRLLSRNEGLRHVPEWGADAGMVVPGIVANAARLAVRSASSSELYLRAAGLWRVFACRDRQAGQAAVTAAVWPR